MGFDLGLVPDEARPNILLDLLWQLELDELRVDGCELVLKGLFCLSHGSQDDCELTEDVGVDHCSHEDSTRPKNGLKLVSWLHIDA